MSSSGSDHLALSMPSPTGDSSDSILSDQAFAGSNNESSKNLIFGPKTTLKNIDVFDITSDKKYIATVDSDYLLHVYKIIGNFEAYEEMSVFEIYNSKKDEEGQHNSIPVYLDSSANGIRICDEKISTSRFPVHVSLSISFNGKLIATSASTLREDRSHFNIYSTEGGNSIKRISTIIDTKSEEYEKFRFVRPVFLNHRFILVTDASIHIFNSKFEKILLKESCLPEDHVGVMFRSSYAACNYISGTLHYWNNVNEMTEEQQSRLKVGEFFNLTKLAYMTRFIKQNILVEPFTINMDRVWQPEKNELIASLTKYRFADIMAISENNKYIAAFDDSPIPTFYIHLVRTGSILHEIELDTNFLRKYYTEGLPIDLTINHASFHLNDIYLFISGYAEQKSFTSVSISESKKMAEKECAFCQLWNISAQRIVYHKEYELRTNKMRNPLIFIEPGPSSTDQLSVTYINSNNNDELKSESFDIPIRDTTVDENQPTSSTFKWKDWNSIGDPDDNLKEQTLNSKENDAIFDLDSPNHHCKRYVLDYKSNKYVLIFGYYSVQMYRLKSIGGTSTDDSDALKSAIGSGTDVKYYRFTPSNELIYIKIYNRELAELNRLLDGEELDAINPNDIQVKFDADGIPGRTLVTRKRRANTSEATEYFDELFLPMELIIQNQSNTDIFEQSEKDNNRNSNDSKDPQTTENDSNTNIQREPEPVNEANTLPTKNNEDTNNNTQNESESTNEDSTTSTQNNEDTNNNTQNESESINERSTSPTQSNEDTNNNTQNESESINERSTSPTQSNEEVQLEGEEIPKKEYKGHEFHYFESAILTLYYSQSIMEKKEDSPIDMIRYLTTRLLTNLIKKYDNTKYFSSESGSFSLYLLSKLPSLHRFIEKILLKEEENQFTAKTQIPLNIFSHQKTKNMLSYRNNADVKIQATDDNEETVNVFTELSKTSRKLFYVLFYRVLMDSRSHGVGNMYAITDLFLFLQRMKYLDILLKCNELLAYFPLPRRFPIPMKDVQKAFNSTFSIQYKSSMLSPDLTKATETLKFYDLKTRFMANKFWINKTPGYFRRLLTYVLEIFEEDDGWKKYEEPVFVTDIFISDTRTLCVVPFPDFLLNTPIIHRSTFSSALSIFNRTDSPFTKIASSKTFNNIFIESNVNIENLTIYKWRVFAGKRYILILFVHAVYYISFSVGVAFAKEVFGYQLGQTVSHPGHYVTIAIMFLSWLVLFVQEIRQFVYNIAAYMNFYNLIDWTALVMPIASFGLLLTGGKYINQVTSTTTLVLWIHALLRLRALKTFGTTLELIIQMSLKTLPFIGAFCSIVIAFTHALIVLLRENEDSFFQEQFSGTLSDPQNPNLNGAEINLSDGSSQNDFKNPFKAFSDVWFLIYGVWDPINDGDAGDDPMIIILSILFSFVIGLIFFNMIIALMTTTIEKIHERGRKNWIHHLAAVVSEVELFWSTPSERLDGLNNPHFVFYIAGKKSYEKHKKKLSKEYKKYLQLHRQDSRNKSEPQGQGIPLRDLRSVF